MNIILALYTISITLFNILLLILNVEFKVICLFNLSYSIFIITISVIKITAYYRLYLETYFKMKDNEYNKN